MAFDPFSAAAGIAGLGFEIFGGMEAAGYAREEFNIEKGMVGVEQQQDTVRQNAMHMQAQRMGLQQVRLQQAARAQALASGTNQGEQYGSALGGAYGSISGQIGTNLSGISNSLQFGDK